MKALTIGRYRLLNTVTALTALLLILFFGMNQIAYGAGSPSRPSTTSESAAQKRERANVYFKQGEALEEMKKYQEASKKYQKAVKIDGKYA